MTDRVQLAEGWHVCPTCPKSYSNLAQHWNRGSCPWPSLDETQRVTIRGLVLGGATVGKQYVNPYLRVVTRYRPLARWSMKQLGWLVSSCYRIPHQSGTSESDATDEPAPGHSYAVRTMTHPELAAFREWYTDDEEMDPPTDQSLSRRALRAWYAHSAFVAWSTTHNSRETGFSAKSPTRKRWVGALLRNLEFDLDPTYRHDSWYLSAAETRRMLAGVGGPVPGVEHKWAFDKEEYQQLRQDQQSRTAWVRDHPREEPPIEVALYPPGAAASIDRCIPEWEPSTELRRQFSDADCLNTIQVAIDQHGPDVSIAAYESWREDVPGAPSSSLLFQRFDGWEDAKALAMSDRVEAPAQSDRPQQYSRTEMLAAVVQAAGALETVPSLQQYESWRDDTFPAATAITDRCGGWPAALSQAGLVS